MRPHSQEQDSIWGGQLLDSYICNVIGIEFISVTIASQFFKSRYLGQKLSPYSEKGTNYFNVGNMWNSFPERAQKPVFVGKVSPSGARRPVSSGRGIRDFVDVLACVILNGVEQKSAQVA